MTRKGEALGRQPIVVYALVAISALSFGWLQWRGVGDSDRWSGAIEKARDFYEHNPQVRLSPLHHRLLGSDFVADVDRAYERERRSAPVFSNRIVLRTQARFESLMARAYDARMREFPAWRYGVAPVSPSPQSFLTYAFVHESAVALAASLVFLVLVGVALESTWGSALFAGFCALSIPLAGLVFTLIGSRASVPWSGASGLVAVLLGAYLVRSSEGGYAIAGWALLPIWSFVEYFFARGIWLDNYRTAPFSTHAVCLAMGASAAFALRLLNVEGKAADRLASATEPGAHPALAVAERARKLGRTEEALQTLKIASAAAPDDRKLALALWDLASDMGRGEEASDAILPIIREELRRGQSDAAVSHWRQLSLSAGRSDADPPLLIRLGEASLDAGHPEDALDALHQALDHPSGLDPALARRIVRVARDLDPELTRRAAAWALRDAQLDPQTKSMLQGLAGSYAVAPATPSPAPPAGEASATTGRAGAGVDRAVEEAAPLKTASGSVLRGCRAPAERGEDESTAPLGLGESPDGRLVEVDPEVFDPHALSLEGLDAEPSAALAAEESAPQSEREFERDTALFDLGGLDGSPAPGGSETQPTLAWTPEASASAGTTVSGEPKAMVDEISTERPLGCESGGAHYAGEAPPELRGKSAASLRSLRVVEGVPLAFDENALEVEIDARGKNRVAFDRIEAIAVAAISGLSARPVLVIDLLINWRGPSDEPLKAIRLAANRFDPRALTAQEGSAFSALLFFVADLLRRSDATPIGDARATRVDEFCVYSGIEPYQREILLAE